MKNYKNIDYIVYQTKDTGHFCAYIKIPIKHPAYNLVKKKKWFQILSKSKGGSGRHYQFDYDKLNDFADVHGGFTFGQNITRTDWPQGFTKGLWAGWDYAHLNDYIPNIGYRTGFSQVGLTIWTEKDVENDIKKAIDQLIK